MQVPFIDLQRLVDRVKLQVIDDWRGCLDRSEFVGGPSITKLERRLEDLLDVTSFTACSNGTDAIMLALRALDIGPHMRVAMPNLTFWATYEAVALAGAEPILIDNEPKFQQMDYDLFVEAYDRFQFDAAILVHLFGWATPRLEDFRRFARQNDIMLIEDGAQCFGAMMNLKTPHSGTPVLSQAQIGTLSFYPAKVLGASGDAGGITTDDIKLADKIQSLVNHGRAGHYTHDYIGYNARSGGLQASYLNRVLDLGDELLDSRYQAHRFYQEYFKDYQDLCRVYKEPEGMKSNGYLNVMTSPHKSGDEVVGGLAHLGVGAARTYPRTLCQQPPARKALRAHKTPVSQDFVKQVYNLPLFYGITLDECQYAAESLIKVLKS